MIPIPVEIDAMLAILNLPKEMGDNGIFKEHKAIVLETIRTLILPEHYNRATQEDMPEEEEPATAPAIDAGAANPSLQPNDKE